MPVFYYVFDVLWLDGYDVRALELHERKRLLRRTLRFGGDVRWTPYRRRDGRALFEEACRRGWEGLIAKRLASPYTDRRSRDWLKFKCGQGQELVIGGYTEPHGSRVEFGALLVGYYDDGALRYAGKVGTGFDEATLRDIGSAAAPARAGQPAVRQRLVHPRARRALGRPRARRGGRLQRVDEPRPPAPSALSRPARRQGRARGGARAMSETLRVGRRSVAISHPDKLLFADPPVSKHDLARHYERVAEAMLPLVRDRPLALQVFPDGIEHHGFFLKSVPAHFPDWIERATVPKRGGTLTQALAQNAATLVYLVGQNVVTLHVWLSRADAPRQPDRLILDFDPSPGATFGDVRAAARTAGERLRDAGLVPFAMVTGSRGVHVVCPLRRGPTFEEVHAWARSIAEAMVRDDPKRLTLEWRKDDRGARIYVDVNRINYAQHAVAPYAVRARPRAPVAMPIHWEELSDARLKPDRWTVRDAADRLAAEGDAWKGMARHARALPRG